MWSEEITNHMQKVMNQYIGLLQYAKNPIIIPLSQTLKHFKHPELFILIISESSLMLKHQNLCHYFTFEMLAQLSVVSYQHSKYIVTLPPMSTPFSKKFVY